MFHVGLFIFFVFTFCPESVVCVSETVSIQTGVGNLEGRMETVSLYNEDNTVKAVSYLQFLGIPYAEPPVGDLRFKKPVPKGAWSGTHNGTYYRYICHQGSSPGPISIKSAVESEDCLTLDIYAPHGSLTNGSSYAVMLFIHGPFGGSNGFIGDALSASGDIIVVVINFRTTFLGFYSSGDSVARGNYGLWDQQLAIKWVNENIKHFNGDPSRVTVAGYSTGAQFALLQAMYPGNKGMIQNVIAHSGILVPTYRTTPYGNTGVERTVETIGCKRETSEATLMCLRSKSLVELNTALHSLPDTFTPVVDGQFIKQDPLTALTSMHQETQDIRDAFSSVNLLTGIDNMEGAMHVVRMWTSLLNQQAETFQVNKTSFKNIVVKTALDLVFTSNLSDAIVDTVVFQYSDLTDPKNALKLRESTVQLSTDIDAAVPAIKTANIHSKMNAVSMTYFFQFAVKLEIDSILTPSWLKGTNLGEEIHFLFGFSRRNLDVWTHSNGFVPSAAERNVSRRMITLWSNFVKNGNPSVNRLLDGFTEWPVYTEMTSSYLDITSNGLFSRMYFREPYITFWTKVVPSLIELGMEKDEQSREPEVPIKKTFSDRFNIDSVTSDNIIVALVTMCGSFLIAFLLVCTLAVSRGTYEKYILKNA